MIEDALEALRRSARKPGLPAPTPEHQAKEKNVAMRKIALAARKEQR